MLKPHVRHPDMVLEQAPVNGYRFPARGQRWVGGLETRRAVVYAWVEKSHIFAVFLRAFLLQGFREPNYGRYSSGEN
jgi:hypothetical protein